MYASDLAADVAAALPGPGWLRSRRVRSAERTATTPLPTVEAEEWRYSPIDDLVLDRFPPVTARPEVVATPLAVAGASATIATVDGFVVDRAVFDDRIELDILSDAVDTDVDTGADSDAEIRDVFALANEAFSPDPIVVRVPAGVTIDGPVVVHHRFAGEGCAAFPRLRLEVGADAAVSLVEVFSGGEVDALSAPHTDIDVGPAARVRYQQIQELGPTMWQLGSLAVTVERDATFEGGLAGMGGGYARMRTDCALVGRGATGNLAAIYYGAGDQTLDFRTFQRHEARDTQSNLVFKGVVDDHSSAVYTGLIRVAPNAAGTTAFQTNRTVKLGEHAWAESVPNLEIENNDVRCSHASTVSPVDPEQRFYLESRGVPTAMAERLIVEGFLADVIEQLPVPEVRAHLVAAVAAELDERSLHQDGPR